MAYKLKQGNTDEPLKKGSLMCPTCGHPLHFELIGTMRVHDGEYYNSYCQECVKYRKVKV